MRALLLVPLISACATRDVYRSEPLVARATCSGHGLAVFGYPYEQEAGCGERVVHLGDGCYLATRPGERAKAPSRPRQVLHGPGDAETHWMPHLFECSTSSPDGHVACVEDQAIGRRDWVFGEDIMRVSWFLKLPNHVGKTWPATWIPATGRCRSRLETWELANLPPPDRKALISTYWHIDYHSPPTPPRQQIQPAFDPISLRRILGWNPQVRARACPDEHGVAVELDRIYDYPDQLERQFEAMIASGLETQNQLEHCVNVEVGLAVAD